MVFSSVPQYLDHHNWHHQWNDNQGNGTIVENPNLTPTSPPLQHGGGGVEGSIRPGSMVDRARLAKLPLPEAGLNCPRCDSTNTKFCYFNNYNLTQPRHFCKACRRYWTRGGALRNVPVGGGCRRNKRTSKSSTRSKSPSRSVPKSLSVSPPRSNLENITSSQLSHPTSLHLPFLRSLSQYGGVGGNISSNLARFHPQSELGNSDSNNFNNVLTIGGGENWRVPNFLHGFEVPQNTNLFNYQNQGTTGSAQYSSIVEGDIRSNMNSEIDNPKIEPSGKMEDNGGSNLSRQFLGMMGNGNQQTWAANSWN